MNRLTALRVAVFVLCAGGIFSVVFGQSKKTYTTETKDGVKYIHNIEPLWGKEQNIKLEFVRKIGDLDAKDVNFQL